MQIEVNLTNEQITALLNQYNSIEEYVQRVLEERANRIIMQDGC